MKTKKSGVRGSVITSADLEKAIKELDGVASGRVKLFGPHEYFEPVAGDGPLARALLPFDKAAAGAVLKSDDKTLSKLAAMWFDVCGMFDREGWLNMSFNLMWNGFINAGSVWMCPQVFGGDYGVFRFNLSKAVRWSFYAQGGAKKDVDRIVDIENGQKRRDMKISEALFRSKGEWTDQQAKAAQVKIVIDTLVERIKGGRRVDCGSVDCLMVEVMEMKTIFGHKIDGLGYHDISPKSAFRRAIDRARKDVGMRKVGDLWVMS